MWSGTVTFGLVSVPVNIMPANRPPQISFHMVGEDGQQLKRRYFAETRSTRTTRKTRTSKKTSASSAPSAVNALGQDDIVRGYEYKPGKFVILEDDELERIAPEQTRDIDLRVFVPWYDIDPMYFVRAYYLTPVGSPKAYKLLARVMDEREVAGIATFVMRAKQYIAAIFSENGILRIETLRFADEIRTPKDVGLPAPVNPRPADVKKVEGMIKRLSKTSFDPRLLADHTADKLTELAKKKAKAGEDVVRAPDEGDDEEQPQTNVIDLMERLQQSLSGSKSSRRRRAAG